MPRSTRVRVQGHDLEVQHAWNRSPRVLQDGTELPRDRFGRYRVTGPDGGERLVAVPFDWRDLTPVVQVGDDRVPLLPPLPRGAWWLLAPTVALSLVGGATGAALGIGAAWVAAQRLRSAGSAAARWTSATGVVLLAVVVHTGIATAIGALR